MKLNAKLMLLSLGITAVPLAIAGYSSARIGQAALRDSIEEHELAIARQLADHIASHIDHLLDILRADARIFDLLRYGAGAPPSQQGVQQFLRLVYHQSDDFSAVALLDSQGQMIGEPTFLEDPAAFSASSRHQPLRAADAESVRLLAPHGDALADGEGVGPVFLGGPGRVPTVVLAVAFDPRLGGDRRVLAAQVSLRRAAARVAAAATADSEVRLLDRQSRVIAAGARATTTDMAGRAPLSSHALPGAVAGALPDRELVAEYVSGGRTVVGAYAPASPFPFGVVVEKPVEAAFLPVERIRWATLFWIGVSAVCAAVVAGAVARGLAARVGALARGSRSIAEGRLDTRLPVRSSDELGDLAASFNAMATSLDSARAEILRQNQEITSWNETLEKRVEEKSVELRQANDLLLRARSLAAVGELGAGVAHEINNPLTGVLGLSQLLLLELPREHPARPLVQDIEDQSLRIRGIVFNLLRLAQRQGGEDYRPVDLPRVVDDAIELCGPTALAEAGITVIRRYAERTPPVRGSATQLQEVFIELVRNARGAMEKGGRLTVETLIPEHDLVRVGVSDTGRGIRPEHVQRIFDPFFTTKADWTGTGMGLSVVHKIVEDHGGTIRVSSEVDKGTTFWLTFPMFVGTVHLE